MKLIFSTLLISGIVLLLLAIFRVLPGTDMRSFRHFTIEVALILICIGMLYYI